MNEKRTELLASIQSNSDEIDWASIQKHHKWIRSNGQLAFCWLVIRDVAEMASGCIDSAQFEEVLNQMVKSAMETANRKRN
jgi:hypothetical protein